jgi:uncharacterized protein YuzE
MARISLAELVAVLKQQPEYAAKWHLDVSAEDALYLAFGQPEAGSVESTVLDVIDGHQLVIDQDREGRVWGIEIV